MKRCQVYWVLLTFLGLISFKVSNGQVSTFHDFFINAPYLNNGNFEIIGNQTKEMRFTVGVVRNGFGDPVNFRFRLGNIVNPSSWDWLTGDLYVTTGDFNSEGDLFAQKEFTVNLTAGGGTGELENGDEITIFIYDTSRPTDWNAPSSSSHYYDVVVIEEPDCKGSLVLNKDYTSSVVFNANASSDITLTTGFRFASASSSHIFSAKIGCNTTPTSRVAATRQTNGSLETIRQKSPSDNNITGLYPNPASHHINIKIPEEGKIVIYSLEGQVLLSQSVKPRSSLNIDMLPNGAYFYKIVTEKHTKTGKIIVDN